MHHFFPLLLWTLTHPVSEKASYLRLDIQLKNTLLRKMGYFRDSERTHHYIRLFYQFNGNPGSENTNSMDFECTLMFHFILVF